MLRTTVFDGIPLIALVTGMFPKILPHREMRLHRVFELEENLGCSRLLHHSRRAIDDEARAVSTDHGSYVILPEGVAFVTPNHIVACYAKNGDVAESEYCSGASLMVGSDPHYLIARKEHRGRIFRVDHAIPHVGSGSTRYSTFKEEFDIFGREPKVSVERVAGAEKLALTAYDESGEPYYRYLEGSSESGWELKPAQGDLFE